MSPYETRNQIKQNFLAVFVGIVLLYASTFGFYSISITGAAAAEVLVAYFLYLCCLLISGFLTCLLAFRKDGYKILAALSFLMVLGDFLYIILDFYTTNTPSYTITMKEVLSLLKFLPGVLAIASGSFLGVFLKYKRQKGMHFKLLLLEK